MYLVSTIQYVRNDRLALNLAARKDFAVIDTERFEHLARRIGAPVRFVIDVLNETVARARELWPAMLDDDGPLLAHFPQAMRLRLAEHWRGLAPALRITEH